MAEQKVKVADIALELGMQTKEILAKAAEIDITIKSVQSSVSQGDAEIIYNYIALGKMPPKKEVKEKKAPAKKSTKDSTAESSAKKTAKKSTKDAESTKKSTAKKAPTKKSAKDSAKTKDSAVDSASETKADSAVDSAKVSKDSARKGKDSAKKAKLDSADSAKIAESSEKKADSAVDSANKAKDSAISQKPIKTIESRKIIIVSKGAKPEPKPTSKEQLSKARDLRDKILHPSADFGDDETPKYKSKKDRKKEVAKKIHTNEQKIDLNRNLGDTAMMDDDDEVMLVDFNEIEQNDKSEDRLTEQVRIQRKNPWFFDSVSRERKKKGRGYHKREAQKAQSEASAKKDDIIKIPEGIRVYEFADKVGLKITDIISTLFKMGEMVTKNDFLDEMRVEILAEEFGLKIEITKENEALEYLEAQSSANGAQNLITRAPVVTIMGHVDHGKTSLLDYIRESRVSKTESGGITQHIGAYMVEKNGKAITFIDTPGHEAFAAMRSRGAQVTDIAIIVIAADDGVKEQTKEALAHAKDSQVQMIIAMNKMDKDGANPDKLKTEMAELGYLPSDWGGTLDFVPVSAKSGAGIDELLDTILIQAELMELKADTLIAPKAVVLEGSLDKGKGPVVTAIVQEGILKVGDSVVADTAYGKIRALIKDNGERVSELKPSEVAILTGLNEVPSAGAILVGIESESKAKEYAMKRKSYLRTKELSRSTKVSLDELSSVVASARLKPLHLIVKADTQGSLEAIKVSLESLSNDEIKVNIIASSVGNITESDIDIAQSVENCYILGFNVKPLGKIKSKAKEQSVAIQSYSVIYDLIDSVKDIIANMMSPIVEEEIIGNIEVRDIFSVGKGNVIAGCFVVEGIVHRGDKVRLLRGEKVLHLGNISSLKRFKDDVKEVGKGYECGIMLDSFNDIKVGDSFEIIKEIFKAKEL
ncbi:translation initiation factor IF-2 [Helicobacter sp. 23-1045]